MVWEGEPLGEPQSFRILELLSPESSDRPATLKASEPSVKRIHIPSLQISDRSFLAGKAGFHVCHCSVSGRGMKCVAQFVTQIRAASPIFRIAGCLLRISRSGDEPSNVLWATT